MTPYFPPDKRSAPYWCPRCEAWYVVISNASCCVLHGPGTCCHVSEQRVDPQPAAPEAP